MRDISARGRTPLLVGGTMLYFRAFLQGLAQMPAADPDIRAALEDEARTHGWPRLHAQLAQVDPEAAARIHPNHSQRIGRALEVYRASGVPLSQWHERGGDSARFDPFAHYRVVQLCVCPAERAVLHERIERRFELMLQAGFLEEVRRLFVRGDLDPDLPALRAVGYRQLWRHLQGRCSLEEAVQDGIAATRQLAKRQLTWLRKWPDLAWIYTDRDVKVTEMRPNVANFDAVGVAPVEAALNYLDLAPT